MKQQQIQKQVRETSQDDADEIQAELDAYTNRKRYDRRTASILSRLEAK